MEPIRICEIVTAVGGALWKGNPNAEVTSVSTNSRELEPGALFVPIVGEKVDAHRFIPMALDTGAVACFTQQEPEEGGWAIPRKRFRISPPGIGSGLRCRSSA